MDYTSEIAAARRANSMPQCMAAFFIERHSLNLATSRDDLIEAGFDSAEIDRHGAAARSLAHQSAERTIDRSAA